MTASPGIAPPPRPYSWPTVLVLLFGTLGRTVFEGVPLSPSVTLVCDVSQQFGPSLFILGRFFFLGVGLGLDMRWAGVAKSFGPTFVITE